MTTPTTRRRDIPALSGARAVAAYAVIATHVGFNTGRALDNQPLSWLLARLDFGVTLFFLLSGFLLSRQFLADHSSLTWPTLRTFWRRRFLRILPAYWLAVAVILPCLSFVRVSPGQWVSYLLMIQTYDHQAHDPSLSQMWTLSVELSFYLALPLLLAIGHRLPLPRRHRMTGLVVLMLAFGLAAELVVHALVGGETDALLWLPPYLDWFALGIGLAVLSIDAGDPVGWQRAPLRWARSAGTCWAVGLMLLWFTTLPLAGPRDLSPATTWEWTLKHLLYGASAFFLLLPLVAGDAGWTERALGNRVMRWLGEISYGVYLWHLALLIALQRWVGWPVFGGHFALLYLLTAAAATLVAAASWHLVERPLLRRFSVSWRRAPASQPPPAPERDTVGAAASPSAQPSASG